MPILIPTICKCGRHDANLQFVKYIKFIDQAENILKKLQPCCRALLMSRREMIKYT